MVNRDAMCLRPLLFRFGGRHLLGSAPVHHVHFLCTQQFGLHRSVDRRHAAANHDHAPADRQR